MSPSAWLKLLAAALLALLAVAWWTTWLDAYVPPLAEWRQQARQTSAGQALSSPPPPRWVTIPPGERAACLKRAGGELNAEFVQCRAGRRELVRTEYDGRRTVLEVKPLD